MINGSGTELNVEVGENKSIVQAKNADQAVRFLGVWLIGKRGKEHVNKIIRGEIEALVQVVKKKRITLSQLIYINNKILLPRAEYRSQTTFLSRK